MGVVWVFEYIFCSAFLLSAPSIHSAGKARGCATEELGVGSEARSSKRGRHPGPEPRAFCFGSSAPQPGPGAEGMNCGASGKIL